MVSSSDHKQGQQQQQQVWVRNCSNQHAAGATNKEGKEPFVIAGCLESNWRLSRKKRSYGGLLLMGKIHFRVEDESCNLHQVVISRWSLPGGDFQVERKRGETRKTRAFKFFLLLSLQP